MTEYREITQAERDALVAEGFFDIKGNLPFHPGYTGIHRKADGSYVQRGRAGYGTPQWVAQETPITDARDLEALAQRERQASEPCPVQDKRPTATTGDGMIATILTGVLLFAALGLAGQQVDGHWWLAFFGPLWAAPAQAAPPDADFTSGGYVYDQALFIEEGQRAVVMAGGVVITPVAFADSLNKIIMCESGNDPEAVNPNGGATGLLQLYPDSAMLRHIREHGYEWSDVTDPFVNLWLGYRWWVRTGGWRQWECRP